MSARGVVTLRPARAEDAALLDLWDRDADVIASNPNDVGLSDWPAEIAAASSVQRIFIAEEDGRPVGALFDIDPAREPTHYWGACEDGLRAFDIWIGAPADRGRGVGAEMVRIAIENAFADPLVTAIIIDPLENNHRARSFYERVGFGPVERRRFGADDCLVMRLERPAA